MSRIHEALKQAEKERVTLPSPSSTQGGEAVEPSTAVSVGSPIDRLSRSDNPISTIGFPHLWDHCVKPGWELNPNENLLVNPSAPHAATEQLRRLRSRLCQIREKQRLKTILITSAVPAEGKTFIANNLAQAIARQQEKRVLLIDADLRCSRLHAALGAPLTPGLSEYLRAEADEIAIVQKGVPEYLCFIPAGGSVPNPAELVGNGRFKRLLDDTGSLFDWIIIDSPPALPVSDSSVLAAYCDAVLLIVRSGFTPYESAQKAAQEFRQRNLIGVVLNRVDTNQTSYSGYEYQYYEQSEKR